MSEKANGNNNTNKENKKSSALKSVIGTAKKAGVGKVIKKVLLKVLMFLLPIILIGLLFYSIVSLVVDFFAGIGEAIVDFFTIDFSNGAYQIKDEEVDKIVEQLRNDYNLSPEDLGLLGDIDYETATEEEIKAAERKYIKLFLEAEKTTQTINTEKFGSNGSVYMRTPRISEEEIIQYPDYSILWDNNNPIISRDEFIQLVENYRPPNGTGESGLSNSEGYEKFFKNLAGEFYDISTQAGINPMVMVAIGTHESGYGTSNIANEKLNLWGWGAYDSSPGESAIDFDSNDIKEGVSNGIEEVATSLKNEWTTPGTWRYEKIAGEGRDPTTLDGIGPLYASDSGWSNKVKQHMLNIFGDKCNLGGELGRYTVLKNEQDLEKMEYLKLEDLETRVQNGGSFEDLRKYYSINEQEQLVLISINNNDVSLITVDYKSMISQYTTPWLFLIDLQMNILNPKFMESFVDMIKDSRITLTVLYNVNTQTTTTTTYTRDDNGHVVEDTVTTTTEESYFPSLMVSTAKTWIFSREATFKENTSGPSTMTFTNGAGGANRVKTSITTFSRTYTEDVPKEEYNGGEKGEDGTFVGMLDERFKIPNSSNRRSAGPDLVSNNEMFFEMLSRSSTTQPWDPIMRYILYKYTGKDYGVTEFDLSAFAIQNMTGVMGYYGSSAEEKVWFALRDAGYSEIVTAGIMGNISQESRFKSDSVNSRSGATGICQWLGGRLDGLKRYASSKGVAVTDLDTQIEFLLTEINKGAGPAAGYASDALLANKGYGRYSFKDQTTIEEAVAAFCWTFERPGDDEANIPNRVSEANRYYNQFKGKTKPTASGVTTDEEASALQSMIENQWIHTQVHKGNSAYQSGPFLKYWSAPYNNLSPFQCTWWANGRASMYLEQYGTKYTKYPTQMGNGGQYYSINAQNLWFQYGSQPRANSIISWTNPGSYGHVAYVEGVTSDGIYISHAGSGKSWFGVQKISLNGSIWSGYHLNGYIYLDSPR